MVNDILAGAGFILKGSSMKFLKQAAATLATTAALLGAGHANAVTWVFSYTGTGVTASGTFTTAGNAATAEPITSISGQRNGVSILRLVPEGEDGDFFYDNLFTAPGAHFSDGGMVFEINNAARTHYNVYFDGGYIEVNATGTQIPITFNVAVVPEAATVGYMGLGLAALGVVAVRRRTARAA